MRLPVALKTAFATAAPTAGDADLADAARAHRRVRIGDVGPDHVDLGHVHVHRARGTRRGSGS